MLIGVFGDDVLVEKPEGALVRRGGEADQIGIEKRAGSRAIGQYLSLDNTRSPSFKYFVAGIKRLTAELLDA
ncbi:hypothetical protein [Leptothrix ochracea]|uniref:hypothetical protein n=1 Tax=Leptothrix ochracea TaxID=735331 RepID=UPI00031E2385|nr:hypothetical protein [Leptothrix ochracea]